MLNIPCTPGTCELIHLKPYSSRKRDDPSACDSLYSHIATPKPTIKTVSVWLDSCLSLHAHSASGSTSVRQGTGPLWRIATLKGHPPKPYMTSPTGRASRGSWGLGGQVDRSCSRALCTHPLLQRHRTSNHRIAKGSPGPPTSARSRLAPAEPIPG